MSCNKKVYTNRKNVPYFPILRSLATTILFSAFMNVTILGTTYKWNQEVFYLF